MGDKTSPICPFQFDLCFALGAPHSELKETKVYGFNDNESKNHSGYVDCIGNISEKLKKNKLPYHQFSNETKKYNSKRIYYKPLQILKKEKWMKRNLMIEQIFRTNRE